MNDRPMRQMSLRAFRDQISDLHAPVEVSKRDGSGNILVLGYWTPYAQHPPDSKPIEPLKPGEIPTATISVVSASGEIVVPPVTLDLPTDDWASSFINTPEEAASRAAVASATRRIKPVPKPGQRSKR